ncbi:HalOD1 output domain-containing protein [Halosegnis marinus]|uniref:HalOD1 output domain-containing protein n=1 Tax=Halosegnis marinus TaxID=3034023 RepID=A0ABD5ZRW8_9EURY|nr:HalOD1 output domain-containing protein [Halosegnis sp. DT85]
MSDSTPLREGTTPNNHTVVVATTDGDSVGGRVVAGVTELRDREMEELPTLAEAVDPDALSSLFDTPGGTRGSVTFEYADCLVTVTAAGDVTVERAR